MLGTLYSLHSKTVFNPQTFLISSQRQESVVVKRAGSRVQFSWARISIFSWLCDPDQVPQTLRVSFFICGMGHPLCKQCDMTVRAELPEAQKALLTQPGTYSLFTVGSSPVSGAPPSSSLSEMCNKAPGLISQAFSDVNRAREPGKVPVRVWFVPPSSFR